MTEGSSFLSAVVTCDHAGLYRLGETLLSLAAQSIPDFDVHVVVVDGSSSGLEELQDLVESFDEGFSSRVRVFAMDHDDPRSPFALGVALSGATYVAPLYPEDVVFAHWAETFSANAARAGGRAMSSLVAVQTVECGTRSDGRFVTTISRPRFPDPSTFDLAAHLASPPVLLRGMALPRLAVPGALSPEMPPVAEGWAVRLAMAMTGGIFETGEVTYLGRSATPTGRDPVDHREWERDRGTALAILEQRGFTIADGTRQDVRQGPGEAPVHRAGGEPERAPAGRRSSARIGILGRAARRLGRRPGQTAGP
jgi:hypothetical protein